MSSSLADIHLEKADIGYRLRALRNSHSEIDMLFKKLRSFGDIILIGGAIRDFALEREPRDIDIIIDGTDVIDLDTTLSSFTYRKNRFGGYKIKTSVIDFDIWSMSDNWAFREKVLEPSVENITHGVFYNFDALVYRYNSGYLDADHFVDSISNNELDLVLDEQTIHLNPNPDVNIVRALAIKREWGLEFSSRVYNYIVEWVKSVDEPVGLLRQAQVRHYGREMGLERDILKFCVGAESGA